MYLNLGGSVNVKKSDVIGIFDLDSAPAESQTMEYLRYCEKNNLVTVVGDGIPKAFVLTDNGKETKIYITTVSASSLKGRSEKY